MRVAYVSLDPGVPVFGHKGCSVHVQGVLGALLRRGETVDLFTPRLGGDTPPALGAVALHPQKSFREREDPAQHAKKLARANDTLREALASSGPYDVVYERYSLWSHAAMEHARDIGVPGILEVNAPLVEEHAAHRGLHHPESATDVERRVFEAASLLVAVSEEVASYLCERGAEAQRVRVVYNGVDPDRFASAARSPDAAAYTVGFVGTLKPWHGLGQLAEAFAALRKTAPESRLRVVGEGPGRDELLETLSRHGAAEAADLIGAVDPADVPAELAAMDVAVAPYSAEGFYFSPLKVYEAMAAGVPVVASRVGQVARVIRDGVTGMLCEPGDASSMARALERLHADPGMRAAIGRAARKEILDQHTWPIRVDEILARAGV